MMQIITMYLRASSVKATLVDEWNQTVNVLPALTRGLRAELVLKLLAENGEPFAPERLDYASWDFAVANDWDAATTPQLRVTEGIAVTANEVHVPLTETNTEELIAALGKNEQAQFGCELSGFTAGETAPEFLIQFDIVVRNRRSDAGAGRPAPVGDGSYTAAQIRALFAAKMSVQLSEDGGTWYDADPEAETPDAARWYRLRNTLAGYEWSDPIPLVPGPRGLRSTVAVGTVETLAAGSAAKIANSGTDTDAVFDFQVPQGRTGAAATVAVGTVETVASGVPAEVRNSGTAAAAVLDFKIPKGPQGETGHEAYLYVAYAFASDGTGFSLAPAASLKYRAEIQRDAPVENPTLADFMDATWTKYLGDDSTVYGDVLVADADTSVARVSRIVFENATIRRGIDGEVIVNFKDAGVTDEEMDRYAVINGRTRLSSWTNGGGSVSAMPGLLVENHAEIPALAAMDNYSAFIG
jgi:hypothetical protein